MKIIVAALLILFSCLIAAGDYSPQKGYSFEPLDKPVFDYVHVIVDVTKFNNWLNTNYSKLNEENMKGPREHLYYLLSSYISELYKRDKVVLPKKDDLILQILFSWSERLGVYGGSLVYNRIKNKNREPIPELMKIPDSFDLSLVNDLYNLKSEAGAWSVKFPYYFMIGYMNDFQSGNGMKTQLVSISTGATKDKTKAGRSQSTLMFVHSPSLESEEFNKYWLNQLEISPMVKPKSVGLNKLESYYAYNKQSQLHKEITFLPSSKGAYLVAYLGMDGAFQTNRPHFLDFLNNLSLAGETTANKANHADSQ